MLTAMVQKFAKNSGKRNNAVTLLPSFIEPGDMTEIKHIAEELEIEYIMYPDTSGVVNASMDGKFHMYPKGGTPKEKIAASGDSRFALALGRTGTLQAAQLLDSKCKVKTQIIDLPIGIRATDVFVDTLRKAAGVTVPESISIERGQLVDVLCDKAQSLYGRKISLMGDPDTLLGLAQFCADAGMRVLHAVKGISTTRHWGLMSIATLR
jgi:nitrogenase molybdenum-iron protein beta chain